MFSATPGEKTEVEPATIIYTTTDQSIPAEDVEPVSPNGAPEPGHMRKQTTFREPTEPTERSSGRKSPRGMTLRRLFSSVSSLLIPEKQVGEAPDVRQSLWAVVRCSYLNILLLFIPVAWALNFALPHTHENRDTLIFVFSFLAIIPLAKLLGFATEELSLRVGQTLAGLLNATLGNAVELIVAIIALVKLVGSILSNLLLVLGMCFFAGGLKYEEQGFGASATQLNSSLLTLSVIAVLLPAAFHFAAGAHLDDQTERKDILSVSRGTAIILLVIYIAYLLFQLWSHARIFQDDSPDVAKSTEFARTTKRREAKRLKRLAMKDQAAPTTITDSPVHAEPEGTDEYIGMSTSRQGTVSTTSTVQRPNATRQEDTPPMPRAGDEEAVSTASAEEPQMNMYVTVGLLVVVTALVAVTAEFLLDSIQGMTEKPGAKITQEFVGIILLPIVGNAAEHATAVTVSVKDKLNLSLSVAAGSSIQIALFVIPLIVTLGWILDKPMTLLFDPYESIVLFFSVLVVNYVTQDGKSNWLEGLILMFLYLILAVTFWFYPAFDASNLFGTCQ